ncbi:MAG: hypothetical protein ABW185_18720 [Sedimenticola sp.]
MPTLPVVPHIDDDISMEFVNDVDMRPNLTDTQVAEDSVNPPPTAQIEDVTFNVPDREFVRPDPVIERYVHV